MLPPEPAPALNIILALGTISAPWFPFQIWRFCSSSTIISPNRPVVALSIRIPAVDATPEPDPPAICNCRVGLVVPIPTVPPSFPYKSTLSAESFI